MRQSGTINPSNKTKKKRKQTSYRDGDEDDNKKQNGQIGE